MHGYHSEHVLGCVGTITIAVPSESVSGILTAEESIALAESGVLTPVIGILSGVVMPLFDARTAVGLSSRAFYQKREIALVGGKQVIGIVFDKIMGTVVRDDTGHQTYEIKMLSRYPYISDVCERNGKMILLLDVEAVIQAVGCGITKNEWQHLTAG